MTQALVVFITAPNEDQAAALARQLVEERLLACANLVPQVRSIYRWLGKVCDEREVLLICKTERRKLTELQERVAALHPYDTPEVIAIPIEAGAPRYLAWLSETLDR